MCVPRLLACCTDARTTRFIAMLFSTRLNCMPHGCPSHSHESPHSVVHITCMPRGCAQHCCPSHTHAARMSITLPRVATLLPIAQACRADVHHTAVRRTSMPHGCAQHSCQYHAHAARMSITLSHVATPLPIAAHVCECTRYECISVLSCAPVREHL